MTDHDYDYGYESIYEDDEQPESKAWTTYDLFSHDDGTISGSCSTNDNLDRGYPTEEVTYSVNYLSKTEMLKRTGGCHTGCSGIEVTVYLDGKRVPKNV